MSEELNQDPKRLAGQYYKDGYNCAEAILRAFRDSYHLDISDEALKMATGAEKQGGDLHLCVSVLTCIHQGLAQRGLHEFQERKAHGQLGMGLPKPVSDRLERPRPLGLPRAVSQKKEQDGWGLSHRAAACGVRQELTLCRRAYRQAIAPGSSRVLRR